MDHSSVVAGLWTCAASSPLWLLCCSSSCPERGGATGERGRERMGGGWTQEMLVYFLRSWTWESFSWKIFSVQKSNTFCDTFCHKIEIRSMDIGKPEREKYLSSLLKCLWSQLASSLIPASARAEGVGPGMLCLPAGFWDQRCTALLSGVSNHDQPGWDGGNHLTHHHMSIQCPVQFLPYCMDWRK